MIFFDFDGTIVDVWDRYYRVFSDTVQSHEIPLLDYINIKRDQIKDEIVAAQLGVTLPQNYWKQKRILLETPNYLNFDRLIAPADVLLRFFDKHDCQILTNRRNREAFFDQLSHLGLQRLAEKSIVLNPDEDITKRDFLRSLCADNQVVLIGDGDAESKASDIPNCTVYLVSTGLRRPEKLPNAERCTIINSINEFMNAYKEIE